MSCYEEQGFFQGDDLIDCITVKRPSDTDNLTIKKAELQVGVLTLTENNPTFPYTVTISRNDSKLLTDSNDVYLRITYDDDHSHENVRTTCIGKLTLKVHAQVVKD